MYCLIAILNFDIVMPFLQVLLSNLRVLSTLRLIIFQLNHIVLMAFVRLMFYAINKCLLNLVPLLWSTEFNIPVVCGTTDI